MSWVCDMEETMCSEEPARSVSGAEALISKHNQHKAEIDTREDSVTQVAKAGRKLIQQSHYASTEIRERLAELKQESESLQELWTQQQARLNQTLQHQQFIREAKLIDTMSSSHEVHLATDKLGVSVDECDALLKKHDAFERLIASQEEKVTAMVEFGKRLCSSAHYEQKDITTRQRAVLQRREKVKQSAVARKNRLEDCRKLMVFVQNCNEAESWIQEKKQVANDESFRDPTNLENKLKKHQEFEAEVNANEMRIQNIAQTGESLVEGDHYASDDIEARVEELFAKWEELLEATDAKRLGLEQALSLVHYRRKVDVVQALIRDRVAVASSAETGRDLEHCVLLSRKFDEFRTELTADKSRLDEVNDEAVRLIAEGHTGEQIISEQQDSLNARWEELNSLAEERRKLLAGAEQVHRFVRDAVETNDRMNEKAKALLTDDLGKDLASVEALIRKHEELERDISAIDAKLEQLDQEAQRLIGEQPASQPLIVEKQSEIMENWEQLTQRADERKANLEQSRELQRFLANLRDLLAWSKDIHDRLTRDELAKSVPEAESLLERHQERKGEIDARDENFTKIKEKGEELVRAAHYAASEIQSRLVGLAEEHARLLETWRKRQELFLQSHSFQVFLRDAEQRETWITTQEAFLSNEDAGDSLDSVEALIKKHQDFEKSLAPQGEKLNALEVFSQKLLAEGHYESEAVVTRRNTVVQRYARLQEISERRARKLADSMKFQHFLRDVDEAESWIVEKMTVASDESYRDPTNLQSKLQKHAAFQGELSSNKGRVDSVTETGGELIEQNHYASHEIEARMEDLRAHWQHLEEKTQDRGQKLKEASEQQQFMRAVEDMEQWILDMEGQMSSEDMGKNLLSVNILIKKHALIESEIQANQDQVDTIMAQVRAFREAGHFQIEQIEDRGRELVAKYCQLEDPMARRHQQLEDSLKLHQFQHDVEDEVNWIHDRQPLASSSDLGRTLAEVQSLQKTHLTLETEQSSHSPVLESVANTAQELIAAKHFACEQIQEQRASLLEMWANLREMVGQRSTMLSDSLHVQQYYAKVSEGMSWLNLKHSLVALREYGKDEDSTQALIKKHEAIELDIEGYEAKIEELQGESQRLVDGGHFDSETITEREVSLTATYSELTLLASTRHHRLVECKQLHRFNRDSDEVEVWILAKEAVAQNEDVGKDLEHVEILQKRFTDFVHNTMASEERVTHVCQVADTLIAAAHTDSKRIEDRKRAISQLWDSLRNTIDLRSMSLAVAKEIHTFDRDSTDVKERVQEKDSSLPEDYGKDLATVQALQRRHEGFERDLAALEKQVSLLSQEAKRLANTYPERASHVRKKEQQTLTMWRALIERSTGRKNKLVEAEQLQRFLNDFRDLSSWISDMIAVLQTDELPRDVSGAEALLLSHLEHKAEIDARQANFTAFDHQGQVLVEAGHYASKEIKEKMRVLSASHKELKEGWEEQRVELEQNLDSQMFKRDAEQAEMWIAMRESLLGSDEIGDSVDTVEELLRLQEDFEKMLAAQEEKFSSLSRETKVEETQRRKREEEERKRKEEEERQREEQRRRGEERRSKEEDQRRELERQRQREQEAQRKRESEKRAAEEQKRREREERERMEKEQQLARELEERLRAEEEKHEYQLSMPEPDMDGVLQRKNELDEGGRKAVMRSWRQYYTVLTGPLLHFYREKRDFQQNAAAAPAINVSHGVCEIAKDYQKKKNALRLKLPSGAEYLLIARDEADLLAWVDAINKAIQNQTTVNPLSQPGHFSPSPLNPLISVSGPGASSGIDTPPDSLPPPPSSLPPPLDDEKLLSPPSAIPSDVADMQAGNGSTEHPSPAVSSHQPHEAAGDDKRRKKGRFKMFGASRKT
ncbi:Spectrin alpha chain, non-erythrocytic 1 [Geodia barretti]|uniref:Spectrin alpha chain, non-erythrocytic 1 n=2 Tax=Geodia barretti TaxID=519541 RepID=A0AA35X7F7_GEOBA|nr:Spectrin alpha chain, non-erythrocytic 1 [Geodia barretti]